MRQAFNILDKALWCSLREACVLASGILYFVFYCCFFLNNDYTFETRLTKSKSGHCLCHVMPNNQNPNHFKIHPSKIIVSSVKI